MLSPSLKLLGEAASPPPLPTPMLRYFYLLSQSGSTLKGEISLFYDLILSCKTSTRTHYKLRAGPRNAIGRAPDSS